MSQTQAAQNEIMERSERKMELYKELATKIDAIENCVKNGNQEWFRRHHEELKDLLNQLPHGSGIDGDWKIEYDKTKNDNIVLSNSYHVMNEVGFYDGWIDFTVIVKPDFISGFQLNIKGRFSDYRWQGESIRECLYQVLYDGLRESV